MQRERDRHRHGNPAAPRGARLRLPGFSRRNSSSSSTWMGMGMDRGGNPSGGGTAPLPGDSGDRGSDSSAEHSPLGSQ